MGHKRSSSCSKFFEFWFASPSTLGRTINSKEKGDLLSQVENAITIKSTKNSMHRGWKQVNTKIAESRKPMGKTSNRLNSRGELPTCLNIRETKKEKKNIKLHFAYEVSLYEICYRKIKRRMQFDKFHSQSYVRIYVNLCKF